jgi:uncharacterized caspase-like protein
LVSANANDRALKIKQMKAENRTALVIGNSEYKKFSILKNSVNDSRAIKDVLEHKGFNVIYLENATKREIKKAIKKFKNLLSSGGIGLFYYAGHGLAVENKNYIVPIKVDIDSKEDVEYEAVPVDQILAKMEKASNRLNIVILDACRNDPFSRSAGGGLVAVDAAKGMYIAYATAPGKVASDGDGKNGVFTKNLLEAINLKGKKIEEVFKQVRSRVIEDTNGLQIPWTSSSITGDFYFTIPDIQKQIEPPKQTIQPMAKQQKTDFEKLLWDEIKDSGNLSSYELFLKEYPNSKYKILAQSKILEVQKKQKEKLKSNKEQEETKLWNEVKDSNNKLALENYINLYPNGKYVKLANIKILKLKPVKKEVVREVIVKEVIVKKEDKKKLKIVVLPLKYAIEPKTGQPEFSSCDSRANKILKGIEENLINHKFIASYCNNTYDVKFPYIKDDMMFWKRDGWFSSEEPDVEKIIKILEPLNADIAITFEVIKARGKFGFNYYNVYAIDLRTGKVYSKDKSQYGMGGTKIVQKMLLTIKKNFKIKSRKN